MVTDQLLSRHRSRKHTDGPVRRVRHRQRFLSVLHHGLQDVQACARGPSSLSKLNIRGTLCPAACGVPPALLVLGLRPSISDIKTIYLQRQINDIPIGRPLGMSIVTSLKIPDSAAFKIALYRPGSPSVGSEQRLEPHQHTSRDAVVSGGNFRRRPQHRDNRHDLEVGWIRLRGGVQSGARLLVVQPARRHDQIVRGSAGERGGRDDKRLESHRAGRPTHRRRSRPASPARSGNGWRRDRHTAASRHRRY